MITPLSVGTTPIVAVNRNVKRSSVRFQNVGTTDIYIKRQIGTTPDVPSATNYDVMLSKTGGDPNEAFFETLSIAQFNIVSSGEKGSVAIFETNKVAL